MKATDTENVLLSIFYRLRDETASKRIPTSSLYGELYKQGIDLGYKPYGSKLKGVDPTTSEWLYDFSWWKIREDTAPQYIESLTLVLESEAGDQRAVVSDFRKLTQARADHRVMVFQTPIRPVMDAAFDIAHTFGASQHGDRYLFVKWGPSIQAGLMVYPDRPEEI